MPLFVIPIIIIIGLFALSAGSDLIQGIDLPLPSFQLFPTQESGQAPAPQSSAPRQSAISQAPSGLSPPFVLETTITQGPAPESAVTDTNKVTFEFEGFVTPTNTTGRITFETFLEGVDDSWKSTSSRQRTITLPAGQKEYVFQVRSKLSNEVDQTPAQRTFQLSISPFWGKVDISSARAQGQVEPSSITLRPQLSSGETLDLTGWKIVGRNGSFTFGLGIEKFNPGFTSIPTDPVVVSRSDTVKLSGARGPFGIGRNFRPNICMGYLKQTYEFPISFSASCSFQKPLESEILSLPIHCQDIILEDINFSSCTLPSLITADCLNYINEHFTYAGCFAEYSNQDNFTKNEWHVYMNTNFINARYDLLKLYDANGLLVDTKELL